jgi:hypothetical protein
VFAFRDYRIPNFSDSERFIGQKEISQLWFGLFHKVAGYKVNIQQCLKSFSTSKLKYPCQIIPITILLKCHKCHPWPEMDVKV